MDKFQTACTQYPEIGRLRALLDDANVRISVVDGNPLPLKADWCFCEVERGSEKVLCPVDDEYGDRKSACAELLLNLMLETLSAWRDAAGFEAWCTETGLAGDETARNIYKQLSVAAPLLTHWFGSIEAPISSFDISLNAGAAQALRNL